MKKLLGLFLALTVIGGAFLFSSSPQAFGANLLPQNNMKSKSHKRWRHHRHHHRRVVRHHKHKM